MSASPITAHLWTAQDARDAAGGTLRGGADWAASGVSIDTRSLKPGDLFVALSDKRDGHDFVPAAFEAGAAAALVARPSECGPELVVGDVMEALRGLAEAARARSSATRVAVTGSVGKTGVKEALFSVFAAEGAAHASERSFNNHWGAPLTLARMPQAAQRAVFELGMNHAGELTDLSALVRPHVAAVTRIAPAHMAAFASLAEIAEAKAEIFSGLEPGGSAIVPVETPHAEILALRAGQAGARLVTFGSAEGADVRILDYVAGDSSGEGEIEAFGQRARFRIPVPGAHWAQNAACIFACAFLSGIPPARAAEALSGFAPPKGRGAAQHVAWNGAEIVLIDDSYNANPASMAAAIAALGTRNPEPGGRRVAVLGEMLELGPDAAAYHAALAQDVDAAGVDLVVVSGDLMGALWDSLPESRRCARASGADAALDVLRGVLRTGDVVLVKGSNASGMGRVATALRGES